METSRITLLPFLSSGEFPDFKQTERLYIELRLVHMQKYSETYFLKFIRLQYLYWGMRLLFHTEIPTIEAEDIHTHTHCGGKTTLLEFCHSRGAGLSTVPEKNRSNVPLVSPGLLIGSAEKWDLCSLFCD